MPGKEIINTISSLESRNSSVTIRRTQTPYLGQNWHYHKEYEIIYFLFGKGVRIVGDHIANFEEGDLILVGKWLPHLFRNEASHDKKRADFVVIKFLDEIEGVSLLRAPELKNIRRFLQHSKRGFSFSPSSIHEAHEVIQKMIVAEDWERYILNIQLLRILSLDRDKVALSSKKFVPPVSQEIEIRLQNVINYIFDNYQVPITLEKVSSISNLSPPVFCRYFKKKTNKTFIQFLNEFRVGQSCHLLINSSLPVKEICYKTGFNSLAHFNRTFKNYTGTSPKNYRIEAYKDLPVLR